MRVQHGVFGGVPTTRWTRSLSKLAHTPNLRVSFGQVALGGLEGVEGVDEGGHGGGGGGGQAFGVWVDVTKVKNNRFMVRRKAVVAKALEAISKCF
ncbi:hypothetical protein Hanom_Chr06g00477881 [Helianthus anomalus]